MKQITVVLKRLAELLIKSSFEDNVRKTWNAPDVKRNSEKFLERVQPYIDNLNSYFKAKKIDLKEIEEKKKDFYKGTEGFCKLQFNEEKGFYLKF